MKVVPNPHGSGSGGGGRAEDEEESTAPLAAASASSSSCDPSLLLSPHRIVRRPMATQADTLVEIATRRVLSAPVPVYRFRQPARLSAAELPFQLVLASGVDGAAAGSLRSVPVDPASAADSWFPGYSWSPLVYEDGGCDGPVHVGWKFSSNDDNSAPSGEREFFYALIVADAREGERSYSLGVVGALGEAVLEGLRVGTRAPAWMLDAIGKVEIGTI